MTQPPFSAGQRSSEQSGRNVLLLLADRDPDPHRVINATDDCTSTITLVDLLPVSLLHCCADASVYWLVILIFSSSWEHLKIWTP